MKPSLFDSLFRPALFYSKSALGLRIKPKKIRIALTNRCNSRCVMCDVWRPEHNHKNDMTLEEHHKILTRNKDFFSQVRHVAVTGGEPTLRDDFVDIVKAIKEILGKVSININTNGFRTKRTLDFAEALLSAGVKVTYNISLDGLDEKHDFTRGIPNIHKAVHKTLKGLLELREKSRMIRVHINHLIMNENVKECERVYAFARERNIRFNPILFSNGEFFKNEGRDLSLSQESKAYLKNIIEDILKKETGRELVFLEILDQILDRPREMRCWGGNLIFLIEDNGDVFPNGGCSTDWALGNLRDSDYSFQTLLASQKSAEILEKVKTCRKCRLGCETMTTLKYPECHIARRKLVSYFSRKT